MKERVCVRQKHAYRQKQADRQTDRQTDRER